MQTVVVRLLPDGTGRVCIHWLMPDPEGPIQTTNQTVVGGSGPVFIKGKRFRMACRPDLSNLDGTQHGGRIVPYTHSDDPRAITCPRCKANPKYAEAMQELATRHIEKGV